jgi:tetratricopeptide (TPR) repeat protein
MKTTNFTRSILPIALISLTTGHLRAQTNADKFNTLFQEKDTVKLKAFLANWEKTNPDDPELYTSAVNYYFYASRQEIVSLDKKANATGLRLTDSTGKVVGYLNSNETYRPDQLSLGLAYIDKGIQKFPKRLDMRFGKCNVLQQIADYNDFATELISTVSYSATIDNNWSWTRNKKLDDGRKFMLETIQQYLHELYDTENDSLLPLMCRIGDATIRHYPDKVEILSTTAVAYTLLKNYDQAITYLQMAHKLDPKDFIVLNNLAHAYQLKGDKPNAITYYELSEKYGDAEAKQQAKKMLQTLRR